MMNFLRRHMRKIFFITIVAFMLGSVVGLGSYMFGEQKYAGSAAVVNGTQIPYKLFSARFAAINAMLQKQPESSPELVKALRAQTLQMLIQEEILWQESAKYGIAVNDKEVALSIQTDPMFFNTQGVFDPEIYFYFLSTMYQKPKDFEASRKKQLAGDKLKFLLASAVKMTDDEYNSALKNTPSATKEQLLNEKVNTYLNVWFANVMENTKIKITLQEAV